MFRIVVFHERRQLGHRKSVVDSSGEISEVIFLELGDTNLNTYTLLSSV